MKHPSRFLILLTLLLCLFTACSAVESTIPTPDDTGIETTTASLDSTTTTATVCPPTPQAPTSTAPSVTEATTTVADTVIPPTTTVEKPITSTPDTTKAPVPTTDPYVGMSEEEFYQNYTTATSLADALYRSQHGFMSGSIAEQDQKPTRSSYQPKQFDLFVRNTAALYGDDGNSYSIVNAYGEIVNTIYKGGGYVSLEEVAAYVYAFGDIPANYTAKKSASPASSVWGKYLRLNHTKFSGDTSRYKYEPELPNISGCGGTFYYYEIDIGTTGTDCDPAYRPAVYNNGSKITRGAARIVYSRTDLNNNKIIDPNEKFVFYTYNHYNDFQEYLNYEGGWGEMFGNITGGGKISSNSNYNPTPYVRTEYGDFTKAKTFITIAIPHSLFKRRELMFAA